MPTTYKILPTDQQMFVIQEEVKTGSKTVTTGLAICHSMANASRILQALKFYQVYRPTRFLLDPDKTSQPSDPKP